MTTEVTIATTKPASVQRGRGSSPYRGVCVRHSPMGPVRYRARISHNGKRHDLGWFPSEIKAAKKHDQRARQLGLLSRLNFPTPEEKRALDTAIKRIAYDEASEGMSVDALASLLLPTISQG